MRIAPTIAALAVVLAFGVPASGSQALAGEPKPSAKAGEKRSKTRPRTKAKPAAAPAKDNDPHAAAGRACSDTKRCPSGMLCIAEPDGGGKKCRIADDTALIDGLSL